MASLVVTVQTPDAPARDLVFGSSPVRVGRGADNDVCLPFPYVSDHHGEVRFDETSASYQDLGSTNGTLVDGRRVDSHKPISVAKRLVIVIGNLTMSFRLQEVDVPGSAVSTQAPARMVAENVPTAPALGSAPDPASPRAPADFRSLPPTFFPTSEPTEPTAPVAGSRYAPPDLFPESLKRDAEPDRSLHRSRLAPPTLFPLGAPVLQPDPDSARGMPSQASGEIHARTPSPPHWSGVHPVSSPDPSILTASVENPSPAPAASPTRASRALTPSPSASISGPGSGGLAAAAGGTDSEQVKRLQKLTRLLCDELVRLRKTYEAFGRETGIRPFPLSEATRLHDLQDGEQLLRYLTSSVLSDTRMEELKKLFADMSSHQLALIGAMLEGARGALHVVAPQNASLSKSRLAIFEDRRWNENLERFTSFVEDDERLLAAVFGPEFAAAYAAARGT